MKKNPLMPGIILVIFLLLTAACQETENPTGRIVVKVTDEPFSIAMIKDASVTITKVEIRAAEEDTEDAVTTEEESPGDSPFITLWEGSRVLELMELRNGVMEELSNVEVPAGAYDLVRVVVVNASIELIDDLGDYAVKVPSGSSSGVKIFIKPGLTVAGGLTSELLLDFSVEKSFVLQGDLETPGGIKGFNFKPVIRAVNNSVAGRIEGMVVELVEEQQLPLEGVRVYLIADNQELSAITDADGKYVIPGVPSGTYEMWAEKEGYPTVKVEVEVVPGNATIRDFVLSVLQT